MSIYITDVAYGKVYEVEIVIIYVHPKRSILLTRTPIERLYFSR